MGGSEIPCFISPEGHRCWFKNNVQKKVGYPLVDKEEKRLDQRKSIKDPTLCPAWPDGGWLPHDWRLIMRKVGAEGRMRVFVPPDLSGFFYHTPQAQGFLANGTPLPISFEESQLQEDKGQVRKKSRTVQKSDYEDAKWLGVLRVASLSADLVQHAVRSAKVPDAAALIERGQEICKLLLQRKFDESTELMLVFKRKAAPAEQKLADWISGWYMRRPATFGGRSWYQFVTTSSEAPSGILCRPNYMFWCEPLRCWKIGPALDNMRAGWARCFEAKDVPSDLKAAWAIVTMESIGKGWRGLRKVRASPFLAFQGPGDYVGREVWMGGRRLNIGGKYTVRSVQYTTALRLQFWLRAPIVLLNDATLQIARLLQLPCTDAAVFEEDIVQHIRISEAAILRYLGS